METTTLATASTLPAPCMTIDGHPIYPGALITPEAYEAEWRRRKPGSRVKASCYFFAHYVSIFVESDDGVEIEVSALVDLRPGHRATELDDYLCRLAPDGAEVEIEDAKLEELHDRLVSAAEDLVR